MNTEIVLSAINVQLAFALYMLLNGISPLRVLKISGIGLAVASLAAVLIMIIFPVMLLWPTKSFTVLACLLSILVAPYVAHYYAREELIPRISTLEVILLNVVALTFIFVVPGIRWLQNPFWMHMSTGLMRWISFVIILWPSWLSLVLIRQKDNADIRLRLVLAIWSVLVYVLLLIGPALEAIKTFDSTSPLAWLASLATGFVAVRVSLLLLLLVELISDRETSYYEDESGARYGHIANFLASRIRVTAIPVWKAVILALGFKLLLNLTLGMDTLRMALSWPVILSLSMVAVTLLSAVFSNGAQQETTPDNTIQRSLDLSWVKIKIKLLVVALFAYGFLTIMLESRQRFLQVNTTSNTQFYDWLILVSTLYLALFAASIVMFLVETVGQRIIQSKEKWIVWGITTMVTIISWEIWKLPNTN